ENAPLTCRSRAARRRTSRRSSAREPTPPMPERAVLNGDATLERVEQAFSMLERAVLRRAQVRPLLLDAWARRASITVADALYVVLAEHRNAPSMEDGQWGTGGWN